VTQQQFIESLCAILKIKPIPTDWFDRRLCFSVTMGYYGKPSSVTIELEGSPPRLPIYMAVNYDPRYRPLMINGTTFLNGEKKIRLCRIIDDFMEARQPGWKAALRIG
jgi:hypothetical protein